VRRGIARKFIQLTALAAAVCFLFASGSAALSHSLTQDSSFTTTCQVQGSGFHSPYAGKSVRTKGVVYADLDQTSRRGFFIQTENCDGNQATSDGLFIYLGAAQDIVKPGDQVEVAGLVQEYFGRTEINAAPADVRILSPGQPLPLPVDLAPPFGNREAVSYLETLEGMYVKLADSRVVGPTDGDDQTWVVRADLGIDRVFPDDPAGTGAVVCVDDSGLYEVAPEAKVGDRVLDLYGSLDYSGGLYCMALAGRPSVWQSVQGLDTSAVRHQPRLQPAGSIAAEEIAAPGGSGFSIATFNLADLFDTVDDQANDDTVLSASEYQRRLQKRALAIHSALGEPEIIAVQEVENGAVLQALLLRPEILTDYSTLWIDGPDERGIDVALLFRPDRVEAVGHQVRQGCTRLVDGFGPDGNRDILDPQNTITCDSDGDGRMDGNRLFSRPPLIVRLSVCRGTCNQVTSGPAGAAGAQEIWLIANHFKSKVEDGEVAQYTLNRRIEEARFVAGLVDEILAHPAANLVVLGDLNDLPGSQPLQILIEKGLRDPWENVARPHRYSYNYHGVSQVLDYTLVHLSLPLSLVKLEPVPINADYPVAYEDIGASLYRSSDHDPLLAHIRWLDHLVYFPFIPTK
jgi:hypothetical protein